MQLTDSYRAAPGCCSSCRSPNPNLPIVDMEFDDPGIVVRRSHVYLCGTCIMQAASLVATAMGRAIVDLDVKTTYAGVVDLLEATERRAQEAEDELAALRAVIARAVEVPS